MVYISSKDLIQQLRLVLNQLEIKIFQARRLLLTLALISVLYKVQETSSKEVYLWVKVRNQIILCKVLLKTTLRLSYLLELKTAIKVM